MLLDVHISICITTALKFYMKVLFFLITHISEITQGNLPIKTRSVTGELSCPMTALVYFYSAFKFHCIVSSFVWEFGQHLSWWPTIPVCNEKFEKHVHICLTLLLSEMAKTQGSFGHSECSKASLLKILIPSQDLQLTL